MDTNKETNSVYKIDVRYILVIISTVIAGLIAHGFAMANFIGSKDALGVYDGLGNLSDSGRWGLELISLFVKFLFGGIILPIPYLNLILSIIFIVVGNIFIIKIIDIKNKIIIGLLSCIMVTYPSFVHSALFIYVTPYYMFSLCLSIIAAWCFTLCNLKSYIAAVGLIVFSLGIYQAYLPMTGVLILIYLVVEALNNKNWKILVKRELTIFLAVLIAVAAYILISKAVCFVKGIELNKYKGISSMGSVSLTELLQRILRTYYYSIGFPFKTFQKINPNPLSKLCIIIIYIVLMYKVISILTNKNINKINRILILATVLLFPICMNGIYIMVPDKETINTMMCYSTAGVFILALIIVCGGQISNWKTNIWSQTTLIASVVLIFEFLWYANGTYISIYNTINKTKNYYEILISRIESIQGYSEEIPISIIGILESDEFVSISGMEQFQLTNSLIGSRLSESWALESYLGRDFGFSPIWEDIDLNNEENKRIVDSMPTYPSYGSIKIVDGHIVIKGAEPKD